MPKIIKDLESKIIESARDLFESESYENVEMKSIAESADIAVGTLYNYFPGKKQLFITVAKIGWKELLISLKSSIIEKKSPRDNLKNLMVQLYTLSEPKKKMWAGFFIEKTALLEKDIDEIQSFLRKMLIKLNNEFRKIIERIDFSNKKEFPNYDRHKSRISYLLMDTVINLLLEFGDDREGNLDFINKFVDYFF